MKRPWSSVVTSWLPAALVPTLVYTGATVWLTWPLARVLHTRFLSEDGAPRSDVLLILWILRWDLHA